ncbi:MAG: LysR family transcriptional regulator [Peptococcaceae bacterium]|nr:LysR family transcriptional regulator [Peptococcaceae bacterium]
MKLRQLEILVAVKECGTITGAAEKLYISQPSLSTALKELETELGVVLMQRNNNGVVFTAVGDEVYAYSQRILQNVAEIQQIPSDLETMESRSMSLASNFFSGTNMLAETILALQQECIQCRKYRFANTMEKQKWETMIENLLCGQLDLAIAKINSYHEVERMELIKKENLVFDELYTEQLYVVARKGHPLSNKRITLLDLKNYPCIFDDNNLNSYITAVYGETFCLSDTLVMETQTGIRRYLASTDAISVMPQYELAQSDRIHGTELEVLQLENFYWTRKVGCLRKNRELNWAEEMFVNKLFELRPATIE